MTPNILDGMKFPFDVNSYVWFDVDAFDGGQTEREVAARAAEHHLPEPMHDAWLPKDLLMPFEKFAVVRRTRIGAVLVTTYERKENVLIMTPRASRASEICRFEHHGDRPPPNLLFEMDPALKARILSRAAASPNGGHIKTEEDLTKDFVNGARFLYWAVLLNLIVDKNMTMAYEPKAHPTNEKRIRKGKKPIFEWKVIDVTAKHVVPESSAPTGRSHASPRRHIRRGHQRRLKSGKVVWINQMWVGRIEFGYIHHSYEARAL
jgi:hypothetical protein